MPDEDAVLSSRFAAVAGRPHLKALLGEQIDMQCQDLRALLRLPLSSKGLDGRMSGSSWNFGGDPRGLMVRR